MHRVQKAHADRSFVDDLRLCDASNLESPGRSFAH
jgi:hypothetical protein